jgi:hypothetical protein
MECGGTVSKTTRLAKNIGALEFMEVLPKDRSLPPLVLIEFTHRPGDAPVFFRYDER